MLRERRVPPLDIFPAEPWAVAAVQLDPRLVKEFAGQAETMFALANGYLRIRGAPEEGRPVREPGVFLNGFHEFRPINYGESASGFPSIGQSILNCPDGTIIKLFIDGDMFVPAQADVLSYRRVLDLRAGTLVREIVWVTPAGSRMRLRTLRLVSFDRRHLAAMLYELVAEATAEIVISSELLNPQPLPEDSSDPRLAAGFDGQVLVPVGTRREGLRAILSYITPGSGLILGCGMDHLLETACQFTYDSSCEGDIAAVVFKIQGEQGKPIRLWKYLGYHYSDGGDVAQVRSQVTPSPDVFFC